MTDALQRAFLVFRGGIAQFVCSLLLLVTSNDGSAHMEHGVHYLAFLYQKIEHILYCFSTPLSTSLSISIKFNKVLPGHMNRMYDTQLYYSVLHVFSSIVHFPILTDLYMLQKDSVRLDLGPYGGVWPLGARQG